MRRNELDIPPQRTQWTSHGASRTPSVNLAVGHNLWRSHFGVDGYIHLLPLMITRGTTPPKRTPMNHFGKDEHPCTTYFDDHQGFPGPVLTTTAIPFSPRKKHRSWLTFKAKDLPQLEAFGLRWGQLLVFGFYFEGCFLVSAGLLNRWPFLQPFDTCCFFRCMM